MITITISGPAAIGKSTLATYLAGHLTCMGCEVEMKDVDVLKGTPSLDNFKNRPITIVEQFTKKGQVNVG